MTLSKLIKYDIRRFKRKGWLCLILALTQAIGLLYCTLQLGRVYWPKILTLHENRNLLVYDTIIYNVCLLIILNIAWGLIYYLEIPFFEQYKIGKGPWPWKDKDPKKVKKWWHFIYCTIARVAFNAVILVPIFQTIALWKDNWKTNYNLEADELPSFFTYAW